MIIISVASIRPRGKSVYESYSLIAMLREMRETRYEMEHGDIVVIVDDALAMDPPELPEPIPAAQSKVPYYRRFERRPRHD